LQRISLKYYQTLALVRMQWLCAVMVKTSSKYVCQQCGYVSPNFLGKCPECNTWSSLVEQTARASFGNQRSKARAGEVINLKDVQKHTFIG